jgi:putative hydrolase of the HAD superfamily
MSQSPQTKPNSGITTVIFDYGAVLSHFPHRHEFERMANVFGAGEQTFPDLWLRNRGPYDRGDLTPEAYWSQMGVDAGRPLQPAQIDELHQWDMEMWARENEAMVAWMRALRAAGIKVGLLSNMHDGMIAFIRNKFAWLNEFDFQTFSAEIKMVKPDADIYEYTLRGLGVSAEKSLFIDDREGNVRTARELGMHAIQFESVEQLRKELENLNFTILPDATPEPASQYS